MLNADRPKRPASPRDVAAETALNTALAALSAVNPLVAGALKRPLGDVLERKLSRNATARIERTMVQAVVLVNKSKDQGREPRSDDFLKGEPGNRSFAEEIVEGVLLTVQSEFQKAKEPYYAQFVDSCIHDPTIDRASAVNILAILDALSYRQLCILALTNRQTLQSSVEYDTRLRVQGENQHRTDLPAVWEETFMQEVFDLESRRLVQISRQQFIESHMVVPSPLGKVVCKVLGLSRIDSAILDELKERAAPVQD